MYLTTRRARRRFDPAQLVLDPPPTVGVCVTTPRYPCIRGQKFLGGLGVITGAPSAMASAIAQAEGFGVAGAIPTLANNPGDLELGDQGYGTITAAGGQQITKFPSVDAGWQALQNQINSMNSGTSSSYSPSMSIAEVGQIYSGGSSNWANNVASILGVSPSANFADVAGGIAAGSSVSVATTDSSVLSDLTQGNTPYYIAGAIALVALTLAAVG